MGIPEIILIVACAAVVAGVSIKSVIDKKHGKSHCDGCNGNCACCHECEDLAKIRKQNKNANQHNVSQK